jgi:hypothetical protein
MLFAVIDGYYLYYNYTVGNPQTDRLLRALGLQHRWTVPCQQDIDDDNYINIDDGDDDDYNAGGESSLKISSSSRHAGNGEGGGGTKPHYSSDLISKVTNPAENNGNLHRDRDDIGNSRYEHDKSIVIDDNKSIVIDDKWGLHAYYDQMNLIPTNSAGSSMHSKSNASSSSSDHHRNQQYHVHSDDHNAAAAHDPSEIDIDNDNDDNDNHSIDHGDMKVDPAEIDIDINFDVIVDNSGDVDVDHDVNGDENGDGNSHQISTSIDCIMTKFDTNAIDLDD